MLTFDQLKLIPNEVKRAYIDAHAMKLIQQRPESRSGIVAAQALCDRAFGNSEQ